MHHIKGKLVQLDFMFDVFLWKDNVDRTLKLSAFCTISALWQTA